MTAEVAVINSSGVALAADSAVTTGQGKIYNSALKLFALSKTEPVGIMVYGNADLMGVPWETIIKVFRKKELKAKSYDTLAEYSVAFFDFIQSHNGPLTDEVQTAWLLNCVGAHFRRIRTDIINAANEHLEAKGSVSGQETAAILSDTVNAHLSELNKREILDGLDESLDESIREKYAAVIAWQRRSIFANLPISESVATNLDRIAEMLFSRDCFPHSSTSGIVIAGFGEQDMFPAIETNEITGCICGRLIKMRSEDNSTKITTGEQCVILSFAQHDMVASFMDGISPQVRQFIDDHLNGLFHRLPLEIDPKYIIKNKNAHAHIMNAFGQKTRSLLQNFFRDLEGYSRREHVDPVLEMVRVLPKDELAVMAETLVSLTAFKRRMTHEMETVGGPIDVAVISKGDGLVWVKRKHYFPGELNQHFFTNYNREL